MDKLIDFVARALCLNDGRIYDRLILTKVSGEPDQSYYRIAAQVAIDALKNAGYEIIKFPAHASLHLMHNEHKSYYQTVEQSIGNGDHGYKNSWVSEEQKQKAIATNECWSVQWYPDTPVGFCILSGADLSAVLDAALADDDSPNDGRA